ncbi:MAG: hypothetical protein IKS39_08835 [Clostridia bacterium]|nr:hypothetical protein [Clostridia bacterium]
MKKIISFILAVILAVSAGITAFAGETDLNTVDEYGNGTESAYTYEGELSEGENSIEIPAGRNTYRIFVPEKSGAYIVSGDFSVYGAVSDLKEDGSYCPCDSFFAESAVKDSYVVVYNFDAGKEYYFIFFGADYSSKTSPETLGIYYVGEVEGMKLCDERTPIIGNNLLYDNDYKLWLMILDFEVTFSGSGEKFKAFEWTTKDEIKSGENIVTVECFGKSFTVSFVASEIDDIISDVTLPEGYKNRCILMYDGTVIGRYPKYVTVHYTDGIEEQLRHGDYQEVLITRYQANELIGWVEYDESGKLGFETCGKRYDLKSEAKKAGPVLKTLYLFSRIKDYIMSIILGVPLAVIVDNEDFFTAVSFEFKNTKESILNEVKLYRDSF